MNLTCKQCGYENEGERVYCHNCGAKLDRSVLPKEPSREESAKDIRKRVQKYANPGRFTFWKGLKVVLSALGWGLVVAVLIEIARPPDGVPPMPTSSVVDAPPVALVMEEALRAPSVQLAISESEINGFLYNSIRAKSSGVIGDIAKYDRTFVELEPGEIWITTQRSVFGYPMYVTIGQALSIQDRKLVARTIGGRLGRLPLHPAIMEYAQFPFTPIWEALKREQKLLNQMQAVKLEKDRVTMVSPAVPPM